MPLVSSRSCHGRSVIPVVELAGRITGGAIAIIRGGDLLLAAEPHYLQRNAIIHRGMVVIGAGAPFGGAPVYERSVYSVLTLASCASVHSAMIVKKRFTTSLFTYG